MAERKTLPKKRKDVVPIMPVPEEEQPPPLPPTPSPPAPGAEEEQRGLRRRLRERIQELTLQRSAGGGPPPTHRSIPPPKPGALNCRRRRGSTSIFSEPVSPYPAPAPFPYPCPCPALACRNPIDQEMFMEHSRTIAAMAAMAETPVPIRYSPCEPRYDPPDPPRIPYSGSSRNTRAVSARTDRAPCDGQSSGSIGTGTSGSSGTPLPEDLSTPQREDTPPPTPCRPNDAGWGSGSGPGPSSGSGSGSSFGSSSGFGSGSGSNSGSNSGSGSSSGSSSGSGSGSGSGLGLQVLAVDSGEEHSYARTLNKCQDNDQKCNLENAQVDKADLERAEARTQWFEDQKARDRISSADGSDMLCDTAEVDGEVVFTALEVDSETPEAENDNFFTTHTQKALKGFVATSLRPAARRRSARFLKYTPELTKPLSTMSSMANIPIMQMPDPVAVQSVPHGVDLRDNHDRPLYTAEVEFLTRELGGECEIENAPENSDNSSPPLASVDPIEEEFLPQPPTFNEHATPHVEEGGRSHMVLPEEDITLVSPSDTHETPLTFDLPAQVTPVAPTTSEHERFMETMSFSSQQELVREILQDDIIFRTHPVFSPAEEQDIIRRQTQSVVQQETRNHRMAPYRVPQGPHPPQGWNGSSTDPAPGSFYADLYPPSQRPPGSFNAILLIPLFREGDQLNSHQGSVAPQSSASDSPGDGYLTLEGVQSYQSPNHINEEVPILTLQQETQAPSGYSLPFYTWRIENVTPDTPSAVGECEISQSRQNLGGDVQNVHISSGEIDTPSDSPPSGDSECQRSVHIDIVELRGSNHSQEQRRRRQRRPQREDGSDWQTTDTSSSDSGKGVDSSEEDNTETDSDSDQSDSDSSLGDLPPTPPNHLNHPHTNRRPLGQPSFIPNIVDSSTARRPTNNAQAPNVREFSDNSDGNRGDPSSSSYDSASDTDLHDDLDRPWSTDSEEDLDSNSPRNSPLRCMRCYNYRLPPTT